MGLETNGCLQFLCGKEKAPVAGHRQDLFARPRQACGDGPRQGNAQRLLAVAGEEMPRAEREEIAAHPHVQRADVADHGGVVVQSLLQFVDQPQRVDGGSVVIGSSVLEFARVCDAVPSSGMCLIDLWGVSCLCQRSDCDGNVPHQFD